MGFHPSIKDHVEGLDYFILNGGIQRAFGEYSGHANACCPVEWETATSRGRSREELQRSPGGETRRHTACDEGSEGQRGERLQTNNERFDCLLFVFSLFFVFFTSF